MSNSPTPQTFGEKLLDTAIEVTKKHHAAEPHAYLEAAEIVNLVIPAVQQLVEEVIEPDEQYASKIVRAMLAGRSDTPVYIANEVRAKQRQRLTALLTGEQKEE